MPRHKRHLRLRSIICTYNNKTVRFDYNTNEKYIGSSEDKKRKFDSLKSIARSKSSTEDQFQVKQNIINSEINSQITTNNAYVIPTFNLTNEITQKYYDQLNPRISETKKAKPLNQIEKNNDAQLLFNTEEIYFMNFDDSLSLDSCQYYLNDDDFDQINVSTDYFKDFLS